MRQLARPTVHNGIWPIRCEAIIIPPLNEVDRGYTGMRLSVCPSVHTTPLTISRVQFFSDCGQTWQDVPGGKISDEFVHGRRSSLNERLTS